MQARVEVRGEFAGVTQPSISHGSFAASHFFQTCPVMPRGASLYPAFAPPRKHWLSPSTNTPKPNSSRALPGRFATFALSFEQSGSEVRNPLHRCWYRGTLVRMADDSKLLVERVQTGVRIEKRILKVLKAFAEYHDMTLGDVLEGIVLHAFDGKAPFSAASLERIRELKKFYELDLDSSASHRLKEIKAKSPRKRATEK